MMNPAPQQIRIYPDAAALAAAAADLIVGVGADAIRQRGRFDCVLSGGSTPEKTYSLLARPDRSRQVDWSKVFLYFGDERMVPADDPRGNAHMARKALIDHLSIQSDHVFPIPTDRPTPAANASAYARTLATAFGASEGGAPPRFDLILLGLGDDGHTASLFPHAAALAEARAWVTASPPGVLPPPVDRVTLTFPVLNAANQVLFLVAGANKAVPVQDVLEGSPTIAERPAAGIRPVAGQVIWLLDEAAAGLLTKERG